MTNERVDADRANGISCKPSSHTFLVPLPFPCLPCLDCVCDGLSSGYHLGPWGHRPPPQENRGASCKETVSRRISRSRRHTGWACIAEPPDLDVRKKLLAWVTDVPATNIWFLSSKSTLLCPASWCTSWTLEPFLLCHLAWHEALSVEGTRGRVPEEGIFLPGSRRLILLVPMEWLPAVFRRPSVSTLQSSAHTPVGISSCSISVSFSNFSEPQPHPVLWSQKLSLGGEGGLSQVYSFPSNCSACLLVLFSLEFSSSHFPFASL